MWMAAGWRMDTSEGASTVRGVAQAGRHALRSNHEPAHNPFAHFANRGYCRDMQDLKLQVPVTEEVEVDAETLAAIDRGIKAADDGRTVSLEEARKMIPKWISEFESQTRR